MCSKCGVNPHAESNPYCLACGRVAKGQPPVPKFRRDSKNKDKCCRCKINAKAPGKQYCHGCANDYAKERAVKFGGWWSTLTDEQKEKAKVRGYINQRSRSGKFPRQPCMVCGAKSEFHHLDYLPRTLNVLHLCLKHHDEVEKLVKTTGITDREAAQIIKNNLTSNSDGVEGQPAT